MNYERSYRVDLKESNGIVERRPYLKLTVGISCDSSVKTEIDCASTGLNLLSIEFIDKSL
jgi:hypothetical protein